VVPLTSPETPIPPTTINAPLVTEVLAVVFDTFTAPVLVNPVIVPNVVIFGWMVVVNVPVRLGAETDVA
jgi:hypothetical protein